MVLNTATGLEWAPLSSTHSLHSASRLRGQLGLHMQQSVDQGFLHGSIQSIGHELAERQPVVIDGRQNGRRRRHEMQTLDAPVGGIWPPLDKASRFQPVDQTPYRDGLNLADGSHF